MHPTLKAEILALIEAAAGREVFAKKDGAPLAALEIKADSYVLETDVHFPTDLNLLWDAGRKCVDVGLGGYKRYVGLGVMSYNLHMIERELLARRRARDKPLALAA